MAIQQNSLLIPSDITALKTRVKAEMQRRCRQGDLSGYASASYDYSGVPATNIQLLQEHFNKILTPLNAIVNQGYSAAENREVSANEVATMSQRLANYANEPMTSQGSSSCSASCSGLCRTGCWNACTGCTSCTSCSGCTSCSSCTGTCTSCSGCTSCTSCTSCSGCSGCGGCGGCTGCSGGCSGCGGCGTACGSCGGSCSGSCQGCSYKG